MASILIVDDSPTIHRVITKRMTTAGHQIVACAHDGNQGAKLYAQHRPDLVLMDITMPNCDGREGLTKIMAISSQARVLMLSAISDPAVMEECRRNGARAFATKDRLSDNGYLEKIVQDVLLLKAA